MGDGRSPALRACIETERDKCGRRARAKWHNGTYIKLSTGNASPTDGCEHYMRKRLEEARRNAEKSKEKAARAAAMRRIRIELPSLMFY